MGIIDLVAKGPTDALYARVMNANLASIMPQVVGVWCEARGHEVTYVCYTGLENLVDELPDDVDVVFICAFTEAAFLAYALSNLFRSRGAVTALGGPHARCYPEDACRYFDYVLGFTDEALIDDLLRDCSRHRPLGLHLQAPRQPLTLPGVRERWKFIEPTLRKAPLMKMIPILGSLGCPYTCSFCIDSVVPYQPLDLDVLREDLRFIVENAKKPIVGWHDPNFGVRFDQFLDVVEDAVPPGTITSIVESSLSLLSEPHLKRLRRNGFKAVLPGIESWYHLGNKSMTGRKTGLEKVREVSDHVNLILRYLPYVQTNFVLGLDGEAGAEPFELTKRFIDLTPGAFPGYSLLSAFGRAAPLNLEYQRADRVLPFPFHFLDNNHAMNVRPENYAWKEFYDHVIDLTKYSFSWQNDLQAVCRHERRDSALDERGARDLLGRLRPDRVLHRGAEKAGHGRSGAELFRPGDGRAAGFLRAPGEPRSGIAVALPARGKHVPRSQGLPWVRGAAARGCAPRGAGGGLR